MYTISIYKSKCNLSWYLFHCNLFNKKLTNFPVKNVFMKDFFTFDRIAFWWKICHSGGTGQCYHEFYLNKVIPKNYAYRVSSAPFEMAINSLKIEFNPAYSWFLNNINVSFSNGNFFLILLTNQILSTFQFATF